VDAGSRRGGSPNWNVRCATGNRLLEDGADPRWLAAAEQEISSIGVAVASARLDTVQRLSALIEAGRDETSPFPFAQIELAGELERMLLAEPAFTVEERYRPCSPTRRRRDAAAGRTADRPQASDLLVRHGPKGEAAQDCSTGEQKALLTGLVLAHARLVSAMSGIAPAAAAWMKSPRISTRADARPCSTN